MNSFFNAVDKIKPVYDVAYKVVLCICKLLLVADILITSMSVLGRYVSFVPDPAWSEEIVLTLMSYMAVLSAALAIRRGAHIRMTAFDVYLPKKLIKVLDLQLSLATQQHHSQQMLQQQRQQQRRLLSTNLQICTSL